MHEFIILCRTLDKCQPIRTRVSM